MPFPFFIPRYYKIDASGRLTHAAEWTSTSKHECSWNEIDRLAKPDPTTEQVESGRGKDTELLGEPQFKIALRVELEQFRDRWLTFWNWSVDKEDAPIQPEAAAELLNTHQGTGVNLFITDILQYPRFLCPDGHILIGGGRYVGYPQPTPGIKYECRHVSEFKGNRGAFDDSLTQFVDYVKWLGRRCNCKDETSDVVDGLSQVVDWIQHTTATTADAYSELESRYAFLADALMRTSKKVRRSSPSSSPSLSTTCITNEKIDELTSKVEKMRLTLLAQQKGKHRKNKKNPLLKFTLYQDALYNAWKDFCALRLDTIKELQGDRQRPKTKRTYADFLIFCGHNKLVENKASGETIYVSDVVETAEELGDVIHACKERERKQKKREHQEAD